jgi:hypothetical protein
MSRWMTVVFVLLMALPATWLVIFNELGPYLCSALILAMTATLAFVSPRRRRLYFVGVAIGLATIVVGLWLTDSGGWCGPVLIPGQAVEAYDGVTPATRYFDACDERALLHASLMLLGSAASALAIGTSLRTRLLPRRHEIRHPVDKRQLIGPH